MHLLPLHRLVFLLALFTSALFSAEESMGYLREVPRRGGAIDLRSFEELRGGGTHRIYRWKERPEFLLKVVRDSVGGTDEELLPELEELNRRYQQLYEFFGEERCLVEYRVLDRIQEDSCCTPRAAIVSVVQFNTCFESEERIGLNFGTVEVDECRILAHWEEYHAMNASLIGVEEWTQPVDLENFLIFEPSWRSPIEQIDEDPVLRQVMREFLEKYRKYYRASNRLMDLKGRDNVLFFREGGEWSYVVGSVLKIETGREAKRLWAAIRENPSLIHDSFSNRTHLTYVPSWMRGLNALAHVVGIDRVIESPTVTKEDSHHLGLLHEVLSAEERAISYAQNDQFERALELFHAFETEEKEHCTWVRYVLGTEYWRYLQENSAAETDQGRLREFLELLEDPQNQFPERKRKKAAEAIEGMKKALVTP